MSTENNHSVDEPSKKKRRLLNNAIICYIKHKTIIQWSSNFISATGHLRSQTEFADSFLRNAKAKKNSLSLITQVGCFLTFSLAMVFLNMFHFLISFFKKRHLRTLKEIKKKSIIATSMLLFYYLNPICTVFSRINSRPPINAGFKLSPSTPSN